MKIPWLDSGGIDRIFVDQLFKNLYKVYDKALAVLTLGFDKSWKSELLSEVNVKTGQVVLDVASGTGLMTFRLADRVGSSGFVIGLDLNYEMTTEALRSNSKPNVTFVQGLAESLPIKDASIDRVTSCYVLKYCNSEQFLGEVKRVLKPQGLAAFYDFSRPRGYLGVFVKLYVFVLLPFLSRTIRPIHRGLGDVLEFLPGAIKSSNWEFKMAGLVGKSGLELLVLRNMTGGAATLVSCRKNNG